jgi:putative MATE family efflux protein
MSPPADAHTPSQRTATARRIAGLALPALVVLAAEPLYVLVDTAVVGHLGAVPLAAVAIGGTVMSLAVWFGTLMAYGTTGRAARRFGAGDRAAAVAEGVQASWLALGAGLVLALFGVTAAGPLAGLLAGDPETAEAAAGWLRIAALGAPGLLLAAAGNGWMRGVQDTRRPLWIVLGANVLSAILCPILVYPAGLGLTGSAIANVTAQTVGGALFLAVLIRETRELRPIPSVIAGQVVLGRDLLIRGAAFQVCFLSATAVASRFGVAAVGAHQIALQLWFFAALALDAVAIAAQSLVGTWPAGPRWPAGWPRWLSPCWPRPVPRWCRAGSPPIRRCTRRRRSSGPGLWRCCRSPGSSTPWTACSSVPGMWPSCGP